MNKSTAIRTGIAGAVAAGGLVVGGVAVATAADDAPSAAADRSDTGRPAGPGGHGPRGLADSAELAKALGVSQDELETAVKAIREDLPRPEKPAAGTRPDPEAQQGKMAAALAEELDLSEAKVTAALESVRADHEADRRDDLADRLDDAVADGDLSDADKASVLRAFDAGVLGGPR